MLRRNTTSTQLNDLRNSIDKWKHKKVPHKKSDTIHETNTLKKS